ncbi:MAG: MFS transporter [Candidatus Korarchaeota archaeon]
MGFIGKLYGRSGRIAYGIGNFGKAFFYYAVGTYITFFYVDVVGLDPTLMAIGLSIPYGIWNAINDPLIGMVSDRLRTRWGRRIPLIMIGTPLVFLTFLALWSPSFLINLDDILLFYYLMLFLALFDFFLTAVTSGYESLFPEMYTDLKERSEASIYREVFALFGVITGFAIFPYLRGIFASEHGTLAAWSMASTLLGAIAASTIMVSLLGCKEHLQKIAKQEKLGFREMIKLTFTNRNFLAFLGADVVLFFLWTWNSAMIPFYTKYVLQGGDETTAIIFGVMLLSAVLWWPLLRKFTLSTGSKRMLIISTTIFAVSLLPLLFLEDLTLIIFVMVMAGCGNAGIQLVRMICLSNVIDEDELKTGTRREGTYVGTMIFFERLMYIVLGALSAYLLVAIGYVPDAPPTPLVKLGFRIAVSVIPFLAFILFLFFMMFFKIDKEEEKRITEEKKTKAL